MVVWLRERSRPFTKAPGAKSVNITKAIVEPW